MKITYNLFTQPSVQIPSQHPPQKSKACTNCTLYKNYIKKHHTETKLITETNAKIITQYEISVDLTSL